MSRDLFLDLIAERWADWCCDRQCECYWCNNNTVPLMNTGGLLKQPFSFAPGHLTYMRHPIRVIHARR